MRDFFHTGLNVSRSDLENIGLRILYPGGIWYVSRNKGSISGDGRSWDQAFLTIREAITAVNLANSTAAYPTRGRNTLILIDEGWYAETPLTLIASDCHIKVAAPGNHDSTVLYGVPVAGIFSGVAGGPALTLRGDNCTIEGLGVYTSDPLYAAIQNGTTGAGGTTNGNKFLGVNCVRDVADGELCGILDYGADGTLIEKCFFSTSCKEAGVRSKTNGVINPVNLQVLKCLFIGTPIGVDQENGHNMLVDECHFLDDTSDRADVVDYPVIIDGSGTVSRCYSALTKAAIVTGGGTIVDIGNYGSDSST